MTNNFNPKKSKIKKKHLVIASILLTIIVLSVGAILMNKGSSRSLDQSFSAISKVQTELRTSVLNAEFNTEEVQSSEPRECRSGLNTRNNSFQRRSFFKVSNITDSSSDQLKNILVSSYQSNGITTQVETESDITNRFRINGSRNDESYSVTFAYSDGGKTATISASTDCLKQGS